MRYLIKALLASSVLAVGACVATPNEPSLTGEYLSGRLAVKKNAIADAAKAFADVYADVPGEDTILRSAFFYQLAAGEIEAAGPLAEAILLNEGEGDDGLARVALGAIALKKNDIAGARRHFEGNFETPFLKSAAFLANVWIEDDLEGSEAAIAKLDAASGDIFRGFNPLHKALLSEKAGNFADARTAHQVSFFGFGGPVGRAAYGAFLERVADGSDAREYYNLLRREPGSTRRLADAGLARLDAGRTSKKYMAVSAQQGAAIGFYSFGAAILEQAAGERARAEEAGFNVGEPRFNLPLALSQLAIYLDPTLFDAHNLVGQIFSVYGDFDAAAESLSAIPSSSPLFEQSRIFIAGGVASRGDTDMAVAMLKDTVRRDPLAQEARFSLANLYATQENHRAAVAEVTMLIDELGSDAEDDAWRYYVTRGGSYIALEKWEKAEADLKKSVELAPEEATALNYLGYSWAERGENLEEAFELIEKAVELQPNSGAIIDSLGWAHYQLGNYNEAVGHLEQAASIEPSDPTITDHLGDVYWQLGREIEARYQWRRVLELETPDKLRELVEQKLAEGLGDQNNGSDGARSSDD